MRFYAMHHNKPLCSLSQAEAKLQALSLTSAEIKAGYYVLAEDDNAAPDAPDYRVLISNTGEFVYTPVSLELH